jgi:hypothetical protein
MMTATLRQSAHLYFDWGHVVWMDTVVEEKTVDMG